ncbi:MAG: methylmalonyl-CoA epimerase [Acidobacteria bacterium]|nr:methylmalonyl-CoA epimerase [Acidobacteriota bacterium]
MKVRLDHVGIAVSDAEAATAFYEDRFGLQVAHVEQVASQQVRAHFLPAGECLLELLEATTPASPIARFLAKRGPGLHHVALAVDDIRGALAELKAAGVRLIDETPRPGAEGALVAFLHPSAADGVLVELKQPAAGVRAGHTPGVELFRGPARLSFGDVELVSLSDGFFALDGGAMFGVVPRTLWEKKLPPDDRHRIPLAMRPLVVRGEQTVLIDAGCGDKMDARSAAIYGLDRTYHLTDALADAGLAAEDIDIVIASHLHFDHVGGFTERRADGRLVPRFPKARYLAHAGEWNDATHPHERNRASYLPENFLPLMDAGVLTLVDDGAELAPGIRFRRSGGHTAHHQVVTIASGGRTAVFAADMYPTSSHLPDPWVMGYDLYPVDTLAFKRAFAREAIEREYLVFFEHDPSMAAGVVRESDGKRSVERVL